MTLLLHFSLLLLLSILGVAWSGRGITDPDLLVRRQSQERKGHRIHDDSHGGNGSNSRINVTLLDCGMRHLALDFAKKLNKDKEVWQHVSDALRLSFLCGDTYQKDGTSNPKHSSDEEFATETDVQESRNLEEVCASPTHCIHVIASKERFGSVSKIHHHRQKDTNKQNDLHMKQMEGSLDRPFSSLHDAIEFSRIVVGDDDGMNADYQRVIVLGPGIHELQGKPIKLDQPQDKSLRIMGHPDEEVWISGGISVAGVEFQSNEQDGVIYAANLTSLLDGYDLPHLLPLFTTDGRWTRARYPNANPETDLWGYASPNRLKYSVSGQMVLEWHLAPPGPVPNFTFVDFYSNPPPGVPHKNDSAQRGFNWYASGHGGVCSEFWGDEANSYWCSNASQGGWAEVDQQSATSGVIQLPVGLTYNKSSELERFRDVDLKGGILHAWHSQSWAMHMFEISQHTPSTGVINLAKGGGRQGARNWCRCDQCTYAAGWCGQHQSPAWHDTRLISGTWMVENVRAELDQPGEYYFDKNTKMLYVMPNTTSDLIDFRIGLLETIIDVSNTKNVTIENVGFRDTVPTYHPKADWSAPSGGDWSLHRGGAVFIENSEDIMIRKCRFRRLDGNAIFLSRRTRNVAIEGNYFEWLGENAIATWGDTEGYDATAEEFPMFTTIQGNVMREVGIFEKQSSAVGQAKAAVTTIRNNIMFNTPRAAINFNDMVGGGDLIEKNLMFNTCRESGDHGPINTWDRQPFLTTLRDGKTKSFDPIPREIRNNFIIANYGASQGVDNDDGSSWYHIHHNLLYSAEGFKMDYGGHDSVFEDNLVMSFPYDGSQCYILGGFLKGHGDIMRRNRCIVGLGHKMDSGCGDPSCSSPRPESDASQQVIGHLWSGCKDAAVELSMNEYFTPNGLVQISCQDDLVTLEEVQSKYGLEKGSTGSKLPDEKTMIKWAKKMLH